MNPDLLAAWLAALRSGDHPKGGDMLRSPAAWRALGVLAHVVDAGAWTQDRWGHWHWHGAAISVPRWLIAGCGLDNHSEWVINRTDWHCPAFGMLADWLELVVPTNPDADRRPTGVAEKVKPKNKAAAPLKLGRPAAKKGK